jgi:hypothetical protein
MEMYRALLQKEMEMNTMFYHELGIYIMMVVVSVVTKRIMHEEEANSMRN